VRFVGFEGKFWVAARDVAKILGFKGSSMQNAFNGLRDAKNTSVWSNGKFPKTKVLNRQACYSLSAKAPFVDNLFNEWLTQRFDEFETQKC